MIFDGEIIEREGFRFRVNFTQDTDMGAPWEEHDGHGIVSEWTSRDKRPGEWTLCSDRSSKRFYDFAETMKKAKKEGWGLCDEHKVELLQRLRRTKVAQPGPGNRYILQELPGPWKPLTKGEITAESVRRDFEHMRGWCNDRWHWQIVEITRLSDKEGSKRVHEDGYTDCLGGVEDSDDKYLEEIVEQLVNEALYTLKKERAEALYWAERDTLTV